MTKAETPQKTDILVIGAGLVGTSFACALNHCPWDITLLENHLLDLKQAPSEKSRPISLAISSQQQCQRLDAWSAIKEHACAIKQVHVSEQHRFGKLSFNANEFDFDALGYVVPFDHLRHTLYRQALSNHKHHIVCSQKLCRIEQHDKHVLVTVQQAGIEKTYQARCLIAADGTHSQTRQLLNIGVTTTDHQEMAITASLKLKRHINTAYERFTPDGIIAILPRPKGNAGMVWTMKPTLAKTAANWTARQWQQELVSRLGRRLGPIESFKVTAKYPLITTIAKQQAQGRAILLGNSAHTFYPIAAQGFNLSLRDASALAFQLQQHGLDNLDQAFGAYLEQRQTDQLRIEKLVSFTSRAFDTNLPGLRQLRAKGLLTLACSPSLKNRLAQRTLGINQYPQSILSELMHDE